MLHTASDIISDRVSDTPQSTPRLTPWHIAITSLATAACAAYLGSGADSRFAPIALAAAFAFIFFMSRSFINILLTGAPALIIFLATQSAAYAAILPCVAVVIGGGALLVGMLRSPLLLTLLPVSYCAAFLLSGDWRAALLSLACFPAAVVLGLSVNGRASRVSAICRTSAALLLTAAVAAVSFYLLTRGSFGISMLRETTNALRERLTAYLISALQPQAALVGDVVSFAEAYTVSLFNLAAAFVIIAANYTAYISNRLELTLLANFTPAESITPNAVLFTMSRLSGMTFVASYIICIVAAESSFTVSVVCENIAIALLPGLALTGLLVMLGLGVGGRGRVRIFMLIATIALLFFQTQIALLVTAAVGAFATIFTKRKPSAAGKSDS